MFIGYRAWEKAGRTPSYPFGHGLGYTDWSYDAIEADGTSVTVRITNSGARHGREVVQVYLAPVETDPERPARWLAGFAGVEVGPGESVDVVLELPRRSFEMWDETANAWAFVKVRTRSRPGARSPTAGSRRRLTSDPGHRPLRQPRSGT